MTDKELLELAAKAIVLTLEWDGPPNQWQPMYYEGKTYHSFDPLEDDGEALRLAVKLNFEIDICETSTAVRSPIGFEIFIGKEQSDPYAATRRAIVRAAAEIGKTMKGEK